MIPNTSVNPAANKNSSRPNCNPFRNCSMTSSMGTLDRAEIRAKGKQRRRLAPPPYWAGRRRSLHRALIMETILVILYNGSYGFERELAFGILDDILQIEILNR